MAKKDSVKRADAAEAKRTSEQRANARLGVRSSDASKVHRMYGFSYLGGHPKLATSLPNVNLVVTDSHFVVEKSADNQSLLKLPFSEVDAVHVETQEEVQSRVTATRLIFTGLLAFAWKKRSGGSIIVTIETSDGPMMFEKLGVTKSSALQTTAPLRSRVSSKPKKYKTASSTQTSTQPMSIADRLDELDALKSSGIVSPAEYTEMRAKILNDI